MGALRKVASIATFGLVSWRSTREKKRRAETKLIEEHTRQLEQFGLEARANPRVCYGRTCGDVRCRQVRGHALTLEMRT